MLRKNYEAIRAQPYQRQSFTSRIQVRGLFRTSMYAISFYVKTVEENKN